MIPIGVDAHKRTHTAVAVDEVGRELGHITVATTAEGHLRLVAWASAPNDGGARDQGTDERAVRRRAPTPGVGRAHQLEIYEVR